MVRSNQRSRMFERLGQADVHAIMTFVASEPRTADVRAVAVTELLRGDRLSLDRLLERYPDFAAMHNRNLSGIPSRSLKSTTAKWMAETLGLADPETEVSLWFSKALPNRGAPV